MTAPPQFRRDPGEREWWFGGAEDVFAFLAAPLSREGRAVNQRRVDEERARAEQKAYCVGDLMMTPGATGLPGVTGAITTPGVGDEATGTVGCVEATPPGPGP